MNDIIEDLDMSSGIIGSDIKDITEFDNSSKTPQFVQNNNYNNDPYSHSKQNEVNNLVTCIETWKREFAGSNSDNLDNLILSEKLINNDEIISCNNSDSTVVSDGPDEIIKSNFEEITPNGKYEQLVESPLKNNNGTDNSTLLTVDDIFFSSMSDPYDIEVYNKKPEILPSPPPVYNYEPVAKTNTPIVANITNVSRNIQDIDMKMIEEAAASREKIRGVCFCKSDKSWTAWWTEKGRNRKKAFKLSIYGFEEARRLAIAHRKAVENRIPELKGKRSIKVKTNKRQVNRCTNVMDLPDHNINNELTEKRSYYDIPWRIIPNDTKRTKYGHYYKSPYQVFRNIRECSTTEDSQIPSPLTSKASIETLENDIVNNGVDAEDRFIKYAEHGKQDTIDKLFTDTPRGVSYSVVNQAWCTQWCNNNGAACMKSFSVSKYGFERSRAMAIEHRYMLESTDQVGSRIPGVFFKNNAWCATWINENGIKHFKSFPVGPNMTYDNARRIAIACKKNASKDTESIDSITPKLNLEPRDLYKLATCTLDVNINDNLNVEHYSQEKSVTTLSNNSDVAHINSVNKALNDNFSLEKIPTMITNIKQSNDCMYNKMMDKSVVVHSHLIKEIPLQQNIANHLSRILLSNQIELQNIVNVKFLVGNGSALQQMLSHKQAQNKLFGLVLTTRDNQM